MPVVVYLLVAQVQGVYVLWEWAPDLDVILSWRLNQGTLAIAALVAFVGVLVMHFAGAYFGSSQKGRRAIATLSLFQASMLGLILADNLFILFTFWELTGLCSFFLINTDADKRDDTFAAAQQALIVTVGGALPMLLGFIYLTSVGSASLTELYALDLPVAAQTIAFRADQECTGSVSFLASRCHGGAYANLRVPAFGNHGQSRPDSSHLPFSSAWRHLVVDNASRSHRRCDLHLGQLSCARPGRH
jgi:hypothetical protein